MTRVATKITASALESCVVTGGLRFCFDCPERAENYARDLSLATHDEIVVHTDWQFFRDGVKTDRAVLTEGFVNGVCVG